MIVYGGIEFKVRSEMRKKAPLMSGLLVAVVLFVGFSSSAEAGRRGTNEVPPPAVIDRTVVTPVISGL